jgi:hypothetical protein
VPSYVTTHHPPRALPVVLAAAILGIERSTLDRKLAKWAKV